jgi:hypothetical protein
MRGLTLREAWLVVAVAAAACGYDNSGPQVGTVAIGKPAANSGDGQTGAPGATLASPIWVQVTIGGYARSGSTVTWSASNGGSVEPATSTTGANGLASTMWTLGPGEGPQTATASVANAAGSPVTFTATASSTAPPAQQPPVMEPPAPPPPPPGYPTK